MNTKTKVTIVAGIVLVTMLAKRLVGQRPAPVEAVESSGEPDGDGDGDGVSEDG